MENQHRLISGYKELDEKQIFYMNMIKKAGEDLAGMIETLEQEVDVDSRWVQEAVMDLQKGFMCLTRSIAKPDFF